MSKLKPFVHTVNGTTEEATGYMFRCPGCRSVHSIFVRPNVSPTGAGWEFNGDQEAPTFSPSILARADFGEERTSKICHSFVVDGKIRFLTDCTHDLKGQTVEIPDWGDEPFGEANG